MDQQTMVVAVAAIIVIAFVILLLKRSGVGSINLPFGIGAKVKTDRPGATIRDTEVDGRGNDFEASGKGSLIEGSRVRGDENTFKAN